MQPGDAVQELRMARQYGVSQTTVREALTRLESAGFVRRVPNVGTFVTQLSVDELREHLRLRL
ncbi:MAG: GntR family transcriptional regulator, partial [Bryobacteraceae bacterium]